MKKYLLPVAFLSLAIAFLLWQFTGTTTISANQYLQVGAPQVSSAVAFRVSGELRRVGVEKRQFGALGVREAGNAEPPVANPVDVAHDPDGAIATFGTTAMPESAVNIDGLADLDNAVIYQLLILPPDMNGDVGPNHYVQIVNSLFRVYDKTGHAMSPPLKISSLFDTLGTVCSTRNDGLAVVQYDQLADRWLISQTCTAFPPFRQMVAVSKTGDPLGQYYSYEFVMPNVKLNDFPKFGVWPDGYYMSTDEYLGADYVGAGAFAFDRTKLLAGDPTASYVYFNLQVPVSPRRRGLLPSDLDGLRPPAAGSPNTFASYTATEYGDPQDSIRLYDFHVDFANPLSSSFSERSESPIAVAAFDPTSPDGRQDIAQPAPGEFLDSQSDRLNYRLAYRNFGTHESLVVNQTVRMTPVGSTYRAGVRVYELQRSGAGYAVAEQATLGDVNSSRWIGSAAQDNQGNIAVQYNIGSEQKKPSIFFTGKLASDPAGVYRAEASLVDGTGVQKAFGWRWGEYSGMNVDPVDDCTFWMTNAYYTLESQEFSDFGWLTRIGTFKFDECTPAPRSAISGTVTNASNGQPIAGAVVNAGVYTRTADGSGSYGSMWVLPGSYSVTVSARGYLSQTIQVNLTNGQTLNRNFALQAIPIIENSGVQVTSESCAMNGAAEPGETVTVNIALQNTGVLAATNLTGSLLTSADVVNPGPAQNYGSLPAGGQAVSRPFTFTVAAGAPCGRVVTLNIELTDGGSPVGVISIPLQTGVQRIAFSENFDDVTAPALPDGWLTSSSPNHQLWRTSATRNQTIPNSLFSPAPHQQGVNEIVTPQFTVTSPNAELRFRNWYELETTFLRNRLYDGSVLEIQLGDGAWRDILFAGGQFISGGYDGIIDSCCQNPLAGHLGWSGRSGVNQTSEFITTRVKLPASAAGWPVRLRWRVGTDIGTFREGQYIDNLVVSDGFACDCRNANRAPFDIDGDRKTDLSMFDMNAGSQPDFRFVKSSNGEAASVLWGTAGDVPANADFDGDGKTDFAVYRPAEGVWYLLQSSDGGFSTVRFGASADVAVPADYDGDGKADVAVYRPSNGVWYIRRSSDAVTTAYQFGLANDKPVSGDFDADGKIDIAVWRPSDATWYVARSSDGVFDILRFGLSDDIPVSGDYDGDGRTDLAVFRPSTATWYLNRSTAGFFAVRFGLTGDTPMQADFDGDGRADIALFRPSLKAWYHLRSSDGGFSARSFGEGNERPLPSIFVDR